MVQILRLNNTTDLLKHNLTFDEVVMTFNARTEPGDYYIDARAGIGNAYLFRYATTNVDQTPASSPFANGIYVDGVRRTDVANLQIPVGVKTTLRLVFSASGTDDVNIFSQNNGSNRLPVDVYDIKFLLGGVLQAHLDATKGTANDQSGNNRNFTLTGGTWMDDGTGAGTPTSTPETAVFATKQQIYSLDTSVFSTSQRLYEGESMSFPVNMSIVDVGVSETVHFPVKNLIYQTDSVVFPTAQRVYSADSVAFATVQNIAEYAIESVAFPFLVKIESMMVIESLATGERYNYPKTLVNFDSRFLLADVPKGYMLSLDQTPADQYLTHLVEPEMGQYVSTTRWPAEPHDPLKTMDKWSY